MLVLIVCVGKIQKRIDKIICIEGCHVIGLFTYPDKPKWHIQLVGDSEQYAATAAAVEFGHCNASQSNRLVELHGLIERVLPKAGIENQHFLVGADSSRRPATRTTFCSSRIRLS